MMTLMFYLGAITLFGLGSLFIRHTSPYTRKGGAEYEKRKKRRLIGVALLIVAAFILVIGLLSQFSSIPQ
jgi:uncharacterized membrane protein